MQVFSFDGAVCMEPCLSFLERPLTADAHHLTTLAIILLREFLETVTASMTHPFIVRKGLPFLD